MFTHSDLRMTFTFTITGSKSYGFKRFAKVFSTRVVHQGPTREITASHASELDWQLALTRRGSRPKIIF